MAGSWMDYGKGLKLSRVNTLNDVDDEAFAKYLLARSIACEYPPCTDQAVGIVKNALPFYLCGEHLDMVRNVTPTGITVVRSCMSAMALEVERAKRLYYDVRDGVETIVVTKQPGVRAIDTASQASIGMERLEAELSMPDGLDIDLFL